MIPYIRPTREEPVMHDPSVLEAFVISWIAFVLILGLVAVTIRAALSAIARREREQERELHRERETGPYEPTAGLPRVSLIGAFRG
jgi:hypothetical protein